MLHIDGSHGEGGGQILRTALALSVCTGRGFRISRIRAGRSRPGLMPQHLAAARAAALICGAGIAGDEAGSSELRFEPGVARPGDYRFDVGTAGSVLLVLQTILLPLALAPGPSDIEIRGGTHVPFSPVFHYMEHQLLPLLAQAGVRASLELARAGFSPRGGGIIRARVAGGGRITGLTLAERGPLRRLLAVSGVAGLPRSIAERQLARLESRLGALGGELASSIVDMPSISRGTFVLARAEFEGGTLCATALGERGKPAERVADEAADELLGWTELPGAVDPYAADQILPFLAFARESSRVSTPRVSLHLLSNAWVVNLFRPGSIRIEGDENSPGIVRTIAGAPSF